MNRGAGGPRVYLALIHYPVYNKRMEVVATSVTNVDLHDISRCAATYAVRKYYLVHPLATQRQLVQEIIDFWQSGYGSSYNPARRDAFSLVACCDSLGRVVAEITEIEGKAPRLVTTDARNFPGSIGYGELRLLIHEEKEPFLILFGTGWGLASEEMTKADYILEPVPGVGEYNHLSVRAAAAVILDRLLGNKWWS